MQREKSLLKTRKASRYSLLYHILKVCRKPKTFAETYWTRPSAFTYASLRELIALALNLKLLKEENGKYFTSEKGKAYIQKFEELLTLLKS
jgi:predicted transcriptional regulator